MSKALALVGSFVLCSCAVDAGDPIAERRAYIANGELEEGEPAVVLVYNRRGGMCTGTLISPRVVLTAKHCVQNPGAMEPSPPESFVIGIGNSIRSLTEQYNVVEVRTTPGVYTSGSTGLRGALVGIDVAVMTLQTGISGFPHRNIRREPPDDLVGDDAVAIGFGQTAAGRSGTKYRQDTRVAFISRDVVYTTPVTCPGDSGGPIIDPVLDEVFAVTSFGTRDSCGTGQAGANAIYPFLEMIDMAVADSGACLNNGAETCDSFDNDCDMLVDETCLANGSPCIDGSECLSNDCRDTAAGRICTTTCDAVRPDLGCGPGLFCEKTTGCEGLCVPLPAATGEGLPHMADCTTDVECATHACIDPGDGRRRCLSPCRAGDGACLGGEVCAAPIGACNGCFAADLVASARQLGEPCADPSECGSGMCLVDVAGAKGACTQACAGDEGCPNGYHCRAERCVRGLREGLGGGCLTNQDCAEDHVCAERDGVHWCASFCDAMPCPANYTCTPAGGASLCVPDQKLLGEVCEADDQCISGVCLDLGDGKVCTRECSQDAYCSVGLECIRAEDGRTGHCIAPSVAQPPPPDDDGCSAGGTTGFGILTLAFFALIAFRRRRS
jgi:V8-like Glu-specific endopeptidase